MGSNDGHRLPEADAQLPGASGVDGTPAETVGTLAGAAFPAARAGAASPAWPAHYRRIERVPLVGENASLAELLRPFVAAETPVIVERTAVMDVERWSEMSHLRGLLGDKRVLVKRSPSCFFRYYDLKKNAGRFGFEAPLEESSRTLASFLEEADGILERGSPERMYLQETLSGHEEMADEFSRWRWELLVQASASLGWGLPDSNELFVGMRDCETPLHFDERENLFFQVRGRKQICLFPFCEYTRLYPFPTTHPCDRQSMVGNPLCPDHEAFPRFAEAVGFYEELNAGDLLYLPYGWWHWLRNDDHLAVSVSFWSKTPDADLKNGIPATFTEHMLTRVRRNLEHIVAQRYGAEALAANMAALGEAIRAAREGDTHPKQDLLQMVMDLLAVVKVPAERHHEFLLEMIDGRFDIDWQRHVPGSGLAA